MTSGVSSPSPRSTAVGRPLTGLAAGPSSLGSKPSSTGQGAVGPDVAGRPTSLRDTRHDEAFEKGAIKGWAAGMETACLMLEDGFHISDIRQAIEGSTDD